MDFRIIISLVYILLTSTVAIFSTNSSVASAQQPCPPGFRYEPLIDSCVPAFERPPPDACFVLPPANDEPTGIAEQVRQRLESAARSVGFEICPDPPQ